MPTIFLKMVLIDVKKSRTFAFAGLRKAYFKPFHPVDGIVMGFIKEN